MWSPILAPRSRQQAAAEIARSCRELFRARGGVTAADPEALIRELRTQDTTIRFPRNVEDVPGFGGVRPPRDSMPPAGAVRVDAKDWPQVKARMAARGPQWPSALVPRPRDFFPGCGEHAARGPGIARPYNGAV